MQAFDDTDDHDASADHGVQVRQNVMGQVVIGILVAHGAFSALAKQFEGDLKLVSNQRRIRANIFDGDVSIALPFLTELSVGN